MSTVTLIGTPFMAEAWMEPVRLVFGEYWGLTFMLGMILGVGGFAYMIWHVLKRGPLGPPAHFWGALAVIVGFGLACGTGIHVIYS